MDEQVPEAIPAWAQALIAEVKELRAAVLFPDKTPERKERDRHYRTMMDTLQERVGSSVQAPL